MKKNTIIFTSALLVLLLLAFLILTFTKKTTFYVEMKVGNEGGSITSEQGLVSGSTAVEKGKDLKIYICPDEGYEIEKVLVDNKEIDLNILVYEKDNPNASSEEGVAVYTFKNISKDYTIEVYYKLKWYKKYNDDSGLISPFLIAHPLSFLVIQEEIQ